MNAQSLPHAAKSRCQKAKSLNPTCAHGRVRALRVDSRAEKHLGVSENRGP